MIRILHLADFHLGWQPSYLDAEKRAIRLKERDELLTKAVDYAINPVNEIDMVLIAGDLFEDYSPPTPLVRYVTNELQRLTGAGIFLATVPGNHDEITYSDSVYRRHNDNWPGLLVTNPMPELVISLEIKGVSVNLYALAYTGGLTNPGRITSFPRADVPGLHIGVFHGSLDWDGVADRSLPLRSGHLSAAGYDYAALGHYHSFSEKKIGRGSAVYPGAPEFKSFKDSGVAHLTVAELSEGDLRIIKVPLAVRNNQVVKVDLSRFDDFDSFLNHCRQFSDTGSMTLLQLMGAPPFPVIISDIYTALNDWFFYLDIEDESYYFSEDFLKNVSGELTVRGSFARRLKEREREDMSERDKKVLKQAMVIGLNALQGSERG